MKISIYDECGTTLDAVLKLDGKEGQEGQDFVKWDGPYHKNGKWSYSEGGVALTNGIVLVTLHSTHSAGNFVKELWVITANVQKKYRLGKMSNWAEKPKNPTPLPDCVFDACIEIWLDIYEKSHPGSKETKMTKWALMGKFL